jgi:hypothetical protein
MLGRADKSNEAHVRARKITGKISVGMTTLISATFFLLIISSYIWQYTTYKDMPSYE